MLSVLLLTFSTAAVDLGRGMAPNTLHYPEPFDFHFPDEGAYPSVASSVQVQMSIGERQSSTFVYVPGAPGRIEVFAKDLSGPGGAVLPAALIDVGVVTFMDRSREVDYLQNAWLRGGLNPEAKSRSPVLPMAIVPDEEDFLANADESLGAVRLRDIDHARAVARPGEGTQFWVTVQLPPSFQPPALRSVYRGDLVLRTGAGDLDVPVEVEVLDVALDDLWDHGKHLGVFQAVDQFAPEFRDTVVSDLVAHGVNGVFHRGATVADYEHFAANGIRFVVNADNLGLGLPDIRRIVDAGFPPLFYGFDEPNRSGRYADQVAISRSIRDRGGLIGTSGSLEALERIDAQVPQDWWNISFSSSWSVNSKVFRYFDELRADSSRKIADLQSVYPMTLLELYPLNTRLLYGFWLFNSNLDGGFAWAYASDTRVQNPYTTTDWNGVAFPAEFYDGDGALHHRAILPSYTWEAFGAAASDFRYALTAQRLLSERGTADQQDRFRTVMSTYQRIFRDGDGARIDVVNPNGAVRQARSELFDLLADLAPMP